MKNKNNKNKQLGMYIGSLMIVTSAILSLTIYLDRQDKIKKAENFIEVERQTVQPKIQPTEVVVTSYRKEYVSPLPLKDSSLEDRNKIKIDQLGVNAEIVRTADPDDALDKGAWMPSDFNTPPGKTLVDSSEPIIIASHLYGFDYWTDQFRNDVSFKGLETLVVGERIEIIWDQRSYVYEIKGGEVNTEISNYDYDLILYTCNDLTGSELRIIKYADLVEDNI